MTPETYLERVRSLLPTLRAHAGNNPDKMASIFARSEFGLPPKELVF